MKSVFLFLICLAFLVVLTGAQKIEIQQVKISGGTFLMGQAVAGDESGFTTTVDSFRMSIYEITNEQYCLFLNEMKDQPENIRKWINIDGNSVDDPNVLYFDWSTDTYRVTPGYENHPVVYVSWHGAMAFAEWVGGSLPTEAEWEYACRAGTTTLFNTGNCLLSVDANYNATKPFEGCPSGEFRNKTTSVGSFQPNPWGLYDMHGNVWEWCIDWFSEYDRNEDRVNPTGAKEGINKVRRGGSYLVNARSSFTSYRNIAPPESMYKDMGFRVVFHH